MMTAKKVAEILKAAGYVVKKVSESNSLEDGEIQLGGKDSSKHVQVCDDGLMCVVEVVPEGFKFGAFNESVEDVLEALGG